MPRTTTLLLGTALGLLVGCSDNGSRQNVPTDLPPSISTVDDATVTANSPELRLGFSISDDRTAAANLTLTLESDGDPLFAGAGPVLEGATGAREFVGIPAPGVTGSATYTITVTDTAGQAAATSFTVTITPQNLVFSTALRTAFAADENDAPQTVNDKEYSDDAANFDDLLSN